MFNSILCLFVISEVCVGCVWVHTSHGVHGTQTAAFRSQLCLSVLEAGLLSIWGVSCLYLPPCLRSPVITDQRH